MESDRAEQRIVKLNGENDQLLAASALLLKVFQCAVGVESVSVCRWDSRGDRIFFYLGTVEVISFFFFS